MDEQVDIFHKILKEYWGYTAFRPLQEEIIRSVYEGNDTLGLMPTGGGKSITFQVPALAKEGICIVITPLIALMKDQVENLRRVGIKATYIYSGLTRQEIITQLENCIFGDYKFLYVSPERLSTEIFLTKIKAMNVNLLVVDESHCISQWGYDFRPSYLRVAEIRDTLPDVPVLALTATATPEVVADIQEKLRFKRPRVYQKSFARENLAYIIRRTEDKHKTLIHILNRVPGTAIVYVRNRKRTREIATMLREEGIEADFFHAGLKNDEKNERQERWKNDQCRVIVSTNAFGMGIDKPDVRLVVHMDMPGSLEEYYQEAGRAGRDGQKAYAVVLYSKADSGKLKKRLSDEFPEREFIYRVYEALGNFYQIAVGFGLDTGHDFNLAEFCAAYKFPLLPTHHALKILELAGYIEYTEETDNASRLMFIATREELYQYLRQDNLNDHVVQVVLRSYTGLFADYVYLDEEQIAKRCGVTPHEVYESLIRLSKYRIINYIPRKKTPMIFYRQPREEQRYLVIPKSAYEERRERSEKRLLKVLEYTESDDTCRSRLLLAYFGEKGAKDCGSCDVCLQKGDSGLSHYEFNRIRDYLMALPETQEGPYFLADLVETMPFKTERSLTAIRFLAEHDDEHFQIKDGYLSIVIDKRQPSE